MTKISKKVLMEQGLVNVYIDEIVPCLRDTETNTLVNTIVFSMTKKDLGHYNADNGWYVDWREFPADTEIYALALKETREIQGLVALKNDKELQATYIRWACTAPHNNKHDFGTQKYSGVGAHLFAIAVDKSVQWGYSGYIYAFAANADLLRHYVKCFEANYVGAMHPYHFILTEKMAQKLLEVYDYEWEHSISS